MPYQPPVEEHIFTIRSVIGIRELAGTARFADFDEEDAAEILAGAGKLASNILNPLQRSGDRHPARLRNGVVVAPPGYAEGYREIAAGGWIGICARPDHGGAGLPATLGNAVNEILNGSCMSLGLSPLLTQSQIRALEVHASDDVKRIYLPQLASGRWLGTMNITEPEAGSDVGALRCIAEAESDGSFRLTGQKIYISWADADFAENVCHLVLARLPSSPAGTKGLSLFIVPKFIPDDLGRPGERNDVRVASLEHKLGLHGSPTAVVAHNGARGWLVGGPNGGMQAMFTMMNHARLGVGCQGVGVAEAAMQLAVDFASERRQGRPDPASGSRSISGHANVRRMLALMAAQIHAARSICASCAKAIDLAESTGEEGWSRRAALLTPVAKVFGSQTGVEVALSSIAVHGGMGYIEDTGVAQLLRDSLVATIYEGTNGIQAIDLVTRKLDSGEVDRLLDETELELVGAEPQAGDLVRAARDALEETRRATEWMAGETDMSGRVAGSEAYLRALALLIGSVLHIRAHLAVGGDGRRAHLARVFIARLLPACGWHCREAMLGPNDLFALADHDFVN